MNERKFISGLDWFNFYLKNFMQQKLYMKKNFKLLSLLALKIVPITMHSGQWEFNVLNINDQSRHCNYKPILIYDCIY